MMFSKYDLNLFIHWFNKSVKVLNIDTKEFDITNMQATSSMIKTMIKTDPLTCEKQTVKQIQTQITRDIVNATSWSA